MKLSKNYLRKLIKEQMDSENWMDSEHYEKNLVLNSQVPIDYDNTPGLSWDNAFIKFQDLMKKVSKYYSLNFEITDENKENWPIVYWIGSKENIENFTKNFLVPRINKYNKTSDYITFEEFWEENLEGGFLYWEQ